jgi:hypothetical protein
MDPTPFIALGLKAVNSAVDSYPQIKQRVKTVKIPGRRRHRHRDSYDDYDYDSYPGPGRDRNGRTYSTQDDYSGSKRSKSRRRRSEHDYDRDGRRGTRRYDTPRGTSSSTSFTHGAH